VLGRGFKCFLSLELEERAHGDIQLKQHGGEDAEEANGAMRELTSLPPSAALHVRVSRWRAS
jgi:hypothetical protein